MTTAVIEPESSEPYFFSQVQDVTERRRAERQKQVIADLGRRAVGSTDVVALISEAMRLVRGILGTTNCVTTRRLASGEVRVVAADGDCHGFSVAPGERSRTDHTLQVAEPVLSDDLSRETRFSVPSDRARERHPQGSQRARSRTLGGLPRDHRPRARDAAPVHD